MLFVKSIEKFVATLMSYAEKNKSLDFQINIMYQRSIDKGTSRYLCYGSIHNSNQLDIGCDGPLTYDHERMVALFTRKDFPIGKILLRIYKSESKLLELELTERGVLLFPFKGYIPSLNYQSVLQMGIDLSEQTITANEFDIEEGESDCDEDWTVVKTLEANDEMPDGSSVEARPSLEFAPTFFNTTSQVSLKTKQENATEVAAVRPFYFDGK